MTKHDQDLTAVDVRRMRELASEHVRHCLAVESTDEHAGDDHEAR